MNTTHKAATSPVSTPRRVLSYDDDSDEDLRPRTSTPVRRHRRRNTIARMDLVTAVTDLSNTTYWLTASFTRPVQRIFNCYNTNEQVCLYSYERYKIQIVYCVII